jgi:hypothetical protein
MLKKLPIGLSTFEKIRNENYLYIDKTKEAYDLIEGSGQYFFLSRPRRFGKSLFVDTLKNIFEGKQALFEGLYIHDKYDWNKRYPVINISFARGEIHSREELNSRILFLLKENQENLEVECSDTSIIAECFYELIKKSYKKYQEPIVILIDEYDKPILDNIDNIEVASSIREGLKDFYSVIKGSDEFLKFSFLTGVSKFSKVSLFSGLNNLEDITLDKRYATITGYTQNDIETSFKEYLASVDLEELKRWYNGYNFLGEGVYNPFDILLFISKGHTYRSYWFETGTPTFLIKLLKAKNYFLPTLETLEVNEEILSSFEVDNISIETLLFQTGYLTIDKVITPKFGTPIFRLKYPNIEVKHSLNNQFIAAYAQHNATRYQYQAPLYNALEVQNTDSLEKAIHTLFAAIPYNNFSGSKLYEYEGYYASVLYSYFASLGLTINAEDVTNRGRIDMTLLLNNYAYVFEFKVVESDPEGSALAQIKERKYFEKYQDKYETTIIGIEFSKMERNIVLFESEKV